MSEPDATDWIAAGAIKRWTAHGLQHLHEEVERLAEALATHQP